MQLKNNLNQFKNEIEIRRWGSTESKNERQK